MLSYVGMADRATKIEGVIVTVGVGLLLCLFFAFTWRVYTFYQQIKQGTLDFSGLQYSSTAARAEDLQALVAGAPGSGQLASSDDPSLGNPEAKITVVEFADFGCPFSAEAHYVVRALAREFPDTVRFIYRDFPLDELHPGATLASEAGECAAEQGKFWEFHDQIYGHSGEFTQASLLGAAENAGVNADTFKTCLQGGKYTAEVKTDLTDGIKAGAVGTPTFFVNGVMIEGAIPYAIFKEIIRAFSQN